MADYGSLPGFSSYLAAASAPPTVTPPPQDTGTGNFLTAGLGSGFHGALASVGGFGEALARAVGANGAADQAAAYAQSQKQQAASYANPDIEKESWYNPERLGYTVAQSLPGLGVGLAGAAVGATVGALAAPEGATAAAATGIGGILARHAALVGGAVASYPLSVGENVDTAKQYYGDLDQGSAAKALAYGVPEAALQGYLPGKLEGMAADTVGQGFKGYLRTVRNSALAQLPVGAATEALTQQMGDPNRTLADRSQDIVSSALNGALLGGITAGAVHPAMAALRAISTKPVASVTPEDLTRTVDANTNPVPPSGWQPNLPGLVLQDQARQVAETPPLQLQLPFGQPAAPEPQQGQLPLRGGIGQPDLFGQPGPNLPFDFGYGEDLTRTVDANTNPVPPSGWQPNLPGLALQDQARQVAETPPLQPQLPFEQPAAPEPQQGQLPLRGGVGQPDLFGQPGPSLPFDFGYGETPPTANPTQQPGLAPAPVVAPANENIRPVEQPTSPQVDPAQAMRDPRNAAFPAAGGVNENSPEVRTVRAAVAQGAAPILQPEDLTPANANSAVRPAVSGLPSLDADLRDPLKGNFPAAGGVNDNATGRGPVQDATPQAGLKPADNVAPANDKLDLAPLQADIKKLPSLRGRDFTTTAGFEDAVAADVVKRGDNALPPALQRIGEAIGVLDKDGNLVGRHAPQDDPLEGPEGPEETLAAGPQVPQGIPRDALDGKPGHQVRWDSLQEAIDALGDNLSDPTVMGLVARGKNLQNDLARVSGGSDGIKAINGEIKNFRQDVGSRMRASVEAPVEDQSALASSTEPSQAAKDFVAERQAPQEAPTTQEQARKKGRTPKTPAAKVEAAPPVLPENIPEVNSAEPAKELPETPETAPAAAAPAEEPTTQEGRRKAARKAPAAPVEAPVDPATAAVAETAPKPATEVEKPLARRKVKAQPVSVDQVEAIKRAKDEAQAVQAVQAEAANPRPKTPATPEIVAQINRVKQTLADLMDKGAVRRETKNFNQQDFNDLLDKHDERTSTLTKAIKDGGLEGMRLLSRDHFGDDLFEKYQGRMTPESEQLLLNHAQAEADLGKTISGLRDNRPLIRYEAQPTKNDVDLTNVIRGTGRVQDALEHIGQTHPNPFYRMIATVLQKTGMDASIKMASREEMPLDLSQKLGEGEVIAASHNDAANRINVYDGSNVAQSVLHEAMHVATVRAIESGSPAAQELRGLFGELQKRAGDSKPYGLTNPAEMVAEAGSNDHFAQWLKSEPAPTGSRFGDMWQAFKNGVFRTLGMPERVRTAFDAVMDTTNKLMGENATKAAITGDRPLLINKGIKVLSDTLDSMGAKGAGALARETQNGTYRLKNSVRAGVLGWLDNLHIADVYAKAVPMMRRYVDALSFKQDLADGLIKPEAAVIHGLNGLSRKTIETLNTIAAHTIQDLDWRKTFDEHLHLKDAPQREVLRGEHAKMMDAYNSLRNLEGGKGLKSLNDMISAYAAKFSARNGFLYQQMAKAYPEMASHPAFKTDMFRDYLDPKNAGVHDDPKLTEAFFKDREAQQREALKSVHSDMLKTREDLKGQVAKDEQAKAAYNKDNSQDTRLPKDVRKDLDQKYSDAKDNFKQLNDLFTGIDRANKDNEKSPYVHMGRDGEHFVRAYLPVDERGVPRQDAVDALRATLEGKYSDVQIMDGLDNGEFYARLSGENDRNTMYDDLKALQQKGMLSQDVGKDVQRGLASNDEIFNHVAPDYMRKLIGAAYSVDPVIPPGVNDVQAQAIRNAHSDNIRELKRALVDLIPQNGLASLYQRRAGVQGFRSDAVANFKKAALANSRGLSAMANASEIGEAQRGMRDNIKSLETSASGDAVTAHSQAVNELLQRSNSYNMVRAGSFMDVVRKATHTFQIGMSPAYVMMLLGQIPTLSAPQLNKHHGYIESVQALARHTPAAFDFMRQIASGPDAATFGVRKEVLDKTKLSDEMKTFHLDMASRGIYTQGYSEAMTGHDQGNKVSRAMHYANAMGRYAETFPRVQLALAARDLYQRKGGVPGFKSAEDYAAFTVKEAQYDWAGVHNARQTTRAGMFGPLTPAINQMMGYQIRATEKLYRETANALGKGDPAETAASRRWLLGHAAAVAVLSGTLGLPMVSVAASVYDRLADWVTGKDDTDVIASYRSFLANSFGKQAGEVIARGAPRALGIDFDHAGEGRIAPGSTLVMALTEKRKMEDAEKDWLKAEAGSSFGFLAKMAFAGRDLSNGDYLDATQKMVPELLEGGIDAYKLAQRGYVDKSGKKLPIMATSGDVLMQALGIDPAKEAEYMEEKRTATGLQSMRTLRSQNITRHMLLAQSRQDPQMLQDWQQEALQYHQDHPFLSGPLQDFGRALSQSMQQSALARGMGTPIGVSPRDRGTIAKTSFGNLRNQ